MITRTARTPLWLRVAIPWAWRRPRAQATKLLGFAATEQGSALDMLRAADLTDDPRLRRLFFRHGLDEARHAQHFRRAARAVPCDGPVSTRAHEVARAERQDLYERLGLVRFVAFVHLSETRAKRQFEVLAARLPAPLGPLFTEIARDEQFHSAYSGQLLDEWREGGRRREVRRALAWVRAWLLWTGARRGGRRVADLVSRGLLAALFVGLVPLFAGIHRLTQRASRRPGWRRPRALPSTLDALRRLS